MLSVSATDPGGKADTATVNINITDANNYAPVFENAPYSASVSGGFFFSMNQAAYDNGRDLQ